LQVSSLFQGSLLRFSVSGEGVGVDPETGELSLPAAALAEGLTVLVTATDAAGAEQSFRLRLAAEPAASAPVLLTPPALEGSGRIGTPLVVLPGGWGGEPAPALALQWLVDGVAIEGATAEAYVPQPADDGRRVTCRVTASNAAGVLAAEPAPVIATREPPVVVGLLADVTLREGEAAATVEAAAAFAGEALRFAAAGAGATIDPATGRLTLPTDAARDAEPVTVTATNSGGAASARFLVTVEARPLSIPPLLLAAPALAGAGKIGSPVSVEPGLWGGLPQPALAFQWLRDGTEIEGATAATYVPGPADDRAALAARVTATNGAGSLAAETAALAVTYVAPALVGELFDEVFDQGVGEEAIATAQVFAGEALGFAARGLGVTIDPATGVLTVSTDAALSGETVTVTATNSGGSAEASFLLTIEAEELPEFPEFPPMIADGAWTAAEVRDAAPAGRRRVTIPAAAAAEGFEVCLYSGAADGLGNPSWRRVMQPGESYVTGSSMKVGSTCHNLLFWRRVADGAWAPASNPVVFEIKGLAPVVEEPATPGFPAANQRLAAPTQAALKAALDARAASGSAAEWIIDLPAGDYGNLVVDDVRLPGKTVLRSADLPSTGAVFRSIQMRRAANLHFEFIHLDREGKGYIGRAIDVGGASGCGFSYCDLNFGTSKVRDEWAKGWAPTTGWGIWMYRDDATLTNVSAFTLHMNYIHGLADCAVFVTNSTRSVFSENVFADISGDDIQLGQATHCQFINNWGTRKKYPAWNPNTGWKHTDFIQTNSKLFDTPGNSYIGNVLMKADWQGITGIPSQGLFGNGSKLSGHLFENNIIVTSSPNAIMYTGQPEMHGNRLRNNTTLRLVDDFHFVKSHEARIKCGGAVEFERNVQCALLGAAVDASGLQIPMRNGNYEASLAYYVSPRMASSFFDCRPVEGQPTHWAFDGERQGAWARFQDVIVNGRYPKLGPAAAGWKASYDPLNQITA
jgi:hypothetical protein